MTNEEEYLMALEQHRRSGGVPAASPPQTEPSEGPSLAALLAEVDVHVEVVAHSFTLSL